MCRVRVCEGGGGGGRQIRPTVVANAGTRVRMRTSNSNSPFRIAPRAAGGGGAKQIRGFDVGRVQPEEHLPCSVQEEGVGGIWRSVNFVWAIQRFKLAAKFPTRKPSGFCGISGARAADTVDSGRVSDVCERPYTEGGGGVTTSTSPNRPIIGRR